MPRPPVDDPRWQAYRHVVKVRFNTEQLNLIDELCAEHGVSRSWLIRGALAKGLPHVFDELVKARAHGLSVRAARANGRRGDRYRGRRRQTLLPVVLEVDSDDGARVDQRRAAVAGRVPEEDG